ncbi:MAG: DMT family transporter, partial [Sandaracinobacteroides sp.]
IVLSIVGVMLLVFDPRIIDEQTGILLTFGASLCWAGGNLLFKRLAGVPILTLYAWQAVVAIPLLVLASIVVEPGGIAALPDAPLSAFLWVGYSAIAASLIGHAGMSWLVQRYPVTLITPFTLPTPLLAVAFATLVYGTPVTPLMWLGGAITLVGVAIITLRTARKAVEP